MFIEEPFAQAGSSTGNNTFAEAFSRTTSEITYKVDGFSDELTYRGFKDAFMKGKIINPEDIERLYKLAESRNDDDLIALIKSKSEASNEDNELTSKIATPDPEPSTEVKSDNQAEEDEVVDSSTGKDDDGLGFDF